MNERRQIAAGGCRARKVSMKRTWDRRELREACVRVGFPSPEKTFSAWNARGSAFSTDLWKRRPCGVIQSELCDEKVTRMPTLAGVIFVRCAENRGTSRASEVRAAKAVRERNWVQMFSPTAASKKQNWDILAEPFLRPSHPLARKNCESTIVSVKFPTALTERCVRVCSI